MDQARGPTDQTRIFATDLDCFKRLASHVEHAMARKHNDYRGLNSAAIIHYFLAYCGAVPTPEDIRAERVLIELDLAMNEERIWTVLRPRGASGGILL